VHQTIATGRPASLRGPRRSGTTAAVYPLKLLSLGLPGVELQADSGSVASG